MKNIHIDSHAVYLKNYRYAISQHFKNLDCIPARVRHNINIVTCVDLSYVDEMMRPHYSVYGPAPTPASKMLRSMLLCIISGTTSLKRWADEMNAQPLYAIACGFEPYKVPGTTTYYDFIKRLWQSDTNNFSPNIRLPKDKVKNPKRPNEKAPPIEKETVADALPKMLASPPKADTPFSLIFRIFEKFLIKSHELGLINLDNLTLAGDGTPVVTAHRQRRHRVSDDDLPDGMPSKALYFSQPDCDIGWDSSRMCRYAGYDLYLLTDVNHDLPIFPLLNPASRHDSFGLLYTWFAFKAHLPNARVNSVILDSAHDAMAYYKYFNSENITPYIDLNKRNERPTIRDNFTLDEDGRPFCPIGLKMWRDGTDYKRMRTKYICPKLTKMEKISISTCTDSVSDSLRGCILYLKHKDNMRYFTLPPRDSDEWKLMYNKRTSSERANKRIKIDFKLEDGKHRSSKMWYFRLYCIMMCQHLNAWNLSSEYKS